jgi:hypothetical protein
VAGEKRRGHAKKRRYCSVDRPHLPDVIPAGYEPDPREEALIGRELLTRHVVYYWECEEGREHHPYLGIVTRVDDLSSEEASDKRKDLARAASTKDPRASESDAHFSYVISFLGDKEYDDQLLVCGST